MDKLLRTIVSSSNIEARSNKTKIEAINVVIKQYLKHLQSDNKTKSFIKF